MNIGFMRWLSLVLLTVQNVSHTLVLRQTRIRKDVPMYSASSAVIVCETIKFILSFAILLYEEGISYCIHETLRNPMDSLKVTVPAIIYVIQNNLLIFALSNLDANIFQVSFFTDVVYNLDCYIRGKIKSFRFLNLSP